MGRDLAAKQSAIRAIFRVFGCKLILLYLIIILFIKSSLDDDNILLIVNLIKYMISF